MITTPILLDLGMAACTLHSDALNFSLGSLVILLIPLTSALQLFHANIVLGTGLSVMIGHGIVLQAESGSTCIAMELLMMINDILSRLTSRIEAVLERRVGGEILLQTHPKKTKRSRQY